MSKSTYRCCAAGISAICLIAESAQNAAEKFVRLILDGQVKCYGGDDAPTAFLFDNESEVEGHGTTIVYVTPPEEDWEEGDDLGPDPEVFQIHY